MKSLIRKAVSLGIRFEICCVLISIGAIGGMILEGLILVPAIVKVAVQ